MKLKLVLLLGAYIGLLVGMAIADVGTIPVCDGKPYSPYLPLSLFAVMALPAFIGYYIGRDDE
jgi:hypothetical protein